MLGADGVIAITQVSDAPLLVVGITQGVECYISSLNVRRVLNLDSILDRLGQTYLVVAIRKRAGTIDSYEQPLLSIALVTRPALHVGTVGNSAIGSVQVEAIAVDNVVSTVTCITECPVLYGSAVGGVLHDIGASSRTSLVQVDILA